jgi:hypothetical protein
MRALAMRALLLLLAFVLSFASPLEAGALPVISATVTPVGGGLFGFEFAVDANDGLLASLFLDGDVPNSGFAITGDIQQIQAFGTTDVDDEGAAAAFDGDADAGYDLTLDSYFLEPWVSNLVGIGIQGGEPGSNDFRIVAGTGPGSMLEVISFAYIVSSSDLNFEGVVQRQGQTFAVSGLIPIPEPGSIWLLGTGLAWLSAFARRSQHQRTAASPSR